MRQSAPPTPPITPASNTVASTTSRHSSLSGCSRAIADFCSRISRRIRACWTAEINKVAVESPLLTEASYHLAIASPIPATKVRGGAVRTKL